MTSAQVEEFLQRLNSAWLTQDYVALAALYHPEVVLLPPDAGEPIEGIDAVCESYRDFHAACTVQRFEITSHASWAFNANDHRANDPGHTTQANQTAQATMVHMRFVIDYQLDRSDQQADTTDDLTMDDRTALNLTEQGLEVYTLLPDSRNRARIVWRAQFAL